MGSGLFDYKEYKTTFKGKEVAMEIRPLKTKEMAIVLPFFMDMQRFKDKFKIEEMPDGTKKVKVDDPEMMSRLFSLQEEAKKILPGAVRNLVGIEDDWTTICEEMYYFTVVIDLLMKLFSITQISENEAKN